ncbi:MAG: hypothetical protein M0Z76_09900 [Gammaproteobacteria bacterium]|nr:hypothetical protein [Gammaproteobacteria bacterium]
MRQWWVLLMLAASPCAWASLQLPDYAQGADLRVALEERAHSITDVIALIVSILAIIGIFIGAGYFATGQSERGRSYVVGSVIALVLAACAYGIANLVASPV